MVIPPPLHHTNFIHEKKEQLDDADVSVYHHMQELIKFIGHFNVLDAATRNAKKVH